MSSLVDISSRDTHAAAGRESRGKGKRKFAARGSWRSGGPGESGGEPLVLLQRPAGAPIPAPESKQQPAAEQGRPWRRRDEYKIAEVCVCVRACCYC